MSSEGKRWTQERFDAEGRQRPLADLWEEAASEVEEWNEALRMEADRREAAEAEVERLREERDEWKEKALRWEAAERKRRELLVAHYTGLLAALHPDEEQG